MAGAEGHRITRWVYAAPGGELIRRTAGMRGSWPGHEAKCSCGWTSGTGGGTRGFVDELVREHKWNVANGFD